MKNPLRKLILGTTLTLSSLGAGQAQTPRWETVYPQADIVPGQLRAAVAGPDGAIYAAGTTGNDILIVKYSSGGVLDRGFNGTGLQTHSGAGVFRGSAVAVDTAGRVYVAGSSRGDGGEELVLLRYGPKGLLDPTFNGTGQRTYKGSGGGAAAAYAVAVDPAGGVYVAGKASNGSNSDVVVLKYCDDGSPDKEFNARGRRSYNGPGNGDDAGYGLVLDASGALYVAGVSGDSRGSGAAGLLLKLRSDGSLDESFAGGVVFFHGRTGTDAGLYSVAVSSSGRVYAGGWEATGKTDQAILLGYGPDGRPLSSWAGGMASFEGSRAYGVSLDGSGDIYVAGTLETGPTREGLLLKFKANGVLDASFNSRGVQTYNAGTAIQAQAFAIAIDGLRNVSVAGSVVLGSGVTEALLLRYSPVGALAKAFTHVDQAGPAPYGAAADDGRGGVLVAGTTLDRGILLSRWDAAGRLDASFGSGGLALYDSGRPQQANSVAVGPTGSIWVTGAVQGPSGSELLLLKYDAAGQLDRTFHNSGIQTFGSGQEVGFSVAPDASGGAYVAGLKRGVPLLLRYRSDGNLDPEFGSGGARSYGGADTLLNALALDRRGSLYAAGKTRRGGADRALIVKFDAQGRLDRAFNGTGVVVYAGDPLTVEAQARGIAVDEDGSVYAAGFVAGRSTSRALILKCMPDGMLDPTFGSGGAQTYAAEEGSSDYGQALAVDGAGSVYLVGTSVPPSQSGGTLVLKTRPDGSLDGSFGISGLRVVRGGLFSGHGDGIALSSRTLHVAGSWSGVKLQVMAFDLPALSAALLPPSGGRLSFVSDRLAATVEVPPGAFSGPLRLALRRPYPLPPTFPEGGGLRPTGAAVELLGRAAAAEHELIVTLDYNDVPLTSFDRARLVAARYDKVSGRWLALPSHNDPTRGRLTTHIDRPALIQLMQPTLTAPTATTKANHAGQPMTFTGLPPGARVGVYAAGGAKVRELQANVKGLVLWDGRTTSGKRAAHGVYFVFVEPGSGSRRTARRL